MIHSEIRCDTCGRVVNVSGLSVTGRWRAHIARDSLRGLGWDVGLPGGRDKCAPCIHDEAHTNTWLDQNFRFAQRFYERHFYEHPINPGLWSSETLRDAARAEGVPVPSYRQAPDALRRLCERSIAKEDER
jgi:hypothetical protein